MPAEPETAGAPAASFRAGEARYFENWHASFVDGAGRPVGVADDVAAAAVAVGRSLARRELLDDAARAMRLAADRVHVIAEGAAACAIAAALSADMAARGHRTIVAIVSGGNIDLPKFAQLVGVRDDESQPMNNVTPGADASRRAALLVACILPVCALLAPCRAGASTPRMQTLFHLTGPKMRNVTERDT